MSLSTLVNPLVTLTLIEMMVTIGLSVTIRQVTAVARDRSLLFRAALANYLFVPAAALALLLAFHAHPMIGVGILIAAVCPGAPYGPPFTGLAKGDVPLSVGLMVLLAASSAVLAPLLLRLLLPIVLGHSGLRVNAVKMLATLLFTQLLPLCVGLLLREWRPVLASRLAAPGRKLSALLNLATFVLIVYVQRATLSQVSLKGLSGMLLLVSASVAFGWLLGGRPIPARRAMTATTAVRNVGVSLVIATGSFPDSPVVTGTLTYAVFQTIVLALFVLAWGRLYPPPQSLST